MLDLRAEGLAKEGDAVGRHADGRVVFIEGALPGEAVRVGIVEERKKFLRGRVLEVLEAHPQRIDPPCPEVARGCGGCSLQHADVAMVAGLKTRIVREALSRIGRIPDVAVHWGGSAPRESYRTTLRCAVVKGRAGFRRRSTHDVVDVASCLVAHPLAEELLLEGSFADADEVTIRVGARTGERLVAVHGATAPISVPDDVVVVDADRPQDSSAPWIHEEAAGRTWRISAGSFFQASPEGVELLVEHVNDEMGALEAAEGPLVDLYSGVGLFAGTVDRGRLVVAVESSESAVADARHNLGERRVQHREVSVERWRPEAAAVVVADPSRRGLGAAAVDQISATGAAGVVLVSCDAASFGRDAGLLADAGYAPASIRVLDLFPQTAHVEVVARFERID